MSIKTIKFKNRTNDKIFVHKFELSNIDEYTIDHVVLPSGTKVTGPQHYDSVDDFSSTQGNKGFYYLYNSSKTNRSVALQYNATYKLFGKPGGTGTLGNLFPFINKAGNHPHKGSTGENLRNIRRWQAPHDGKIRVKGTFKDQDLGGGDGIFGWAMHWSNAGKKSWNDNGSYITSYDANTGVAKGFSGDITGKKISPWAADQKTGYDKNKMVDFNDTGALFPGNVDMNSLKKNNLAVPLKARYIRWYPKTWYNHITMRVGAYDMSGNELVNSRPKSSFKASSVWDNRDDHSAWRARLVNHHNGHSNWSSSANSVGHWIQVDLGSVKEISAVSTKGRHCCYHQWVKSYFLAYSADGSNWTQAHPNKLIERIHERSYDVELNVKKGDFIDNFTGPDVTPNYDSTGDTMNIEYLSTNYWLDENGVLRDSSNLLTGVVLEDEESIDVHLDKVGIGGDDGVANESLKIHHLCNPPGGYASLYDENTSKVSFGAAGAPGWYTIKSKLTGHTLYAYLPKDSYAGNGFFLEYSFFKGWIHKAGVAENPWSEGEWFHADPNKDGTGIGWFWFNMDIFPFVYLKKYNSWGYLGKHTTKTNPGNWQFKDLCVWIYDLNTWKWFGTDSPADSDSSISWIDNTKSNITKSGNVVTNATPSSATIESTPSSFVGWGESKQHTISLTGVALDEYDSPSTLTINSDHSAVTGQYTRQSNLYNYRYEWVNGSGSRLCWLDNGWVVCSGDRSTKYAKYVGNENFPEDGSYYSSRNSMNRSTKTGWKNLVASITTLYCTWSSRNTSNTTLTKPSLGNELRLDLDNSGKIYRYEIGDTEDRSTSGAWEIYIGFSRKNTNKSYSYITGESHAVLNLKDIPIKDHIDLAGGPYMKARRIGFVSTGSGVSYGPWSDNVDVHVPFLYIKGVYNDAGTRRKKGWINAYICTDKKNQMGALFYDCGQDTRFTIIAKKGDIEFKYPLLRSGCHVYVGVNNNLQPLMEAGVWSLKVLCNDRVLLSQNITIRSGNTWADPKIVQQQSAKYDTGIDLQGWLPIIGGVGYKGWYNNNWECCTENVYDMKLCDSCYCETSLTPEVNGAGPANWPNFNEYWSTRSNSWPMPGSASRVDGALAKVTPNSDGTLIITTKPANSGGIHHYIYTMFSKVFKLAEFTNGLCVTAGFKAQITSRNRMATDFVVKQIDDSGGMNFYIMSMMGDTSGCHGCVEKGGVRHKTLEQVIATPSMLQHTYGDGPKHPDFSKDKEFQVGFAWANSTSESTLKSWDHSICIGGIETY